MTLKTAAAGLALALIGGALASSPAQAGSISHTCSSGAYGTAYGACLYYNSPKPLNAEYGAKGAVYSMNYTTNGGDYHLFVAGNQGSGGAGSNVWNGAGGAKSWFTSKNFRVHVNTGYGTMSQNPYDQINYGNNAVKLSNAYNNNTSIEII